MTLKAKCRCINLFSVSLFLVYLFFFYGRNTAHTESSQELTPYTEPHMVSSKAPEHIECNHNHTCSHWADVSEMHTHTFTGISQVLYEAPQGKLLEPENGFGDFHGVVVHCTAKGTIASALRSHVSQGYDDLGYHIMIDREGKLYFSGRWHKTQGLPKNFHGAHAAIGPRTTGRKEILEHVTRFETPRRSHSQFFNDTFIGVCLDIVEKPDGTLTEFTPAQQQSLDFVLARLQEVYAPEQSDRWNITGHTCIAHKACPGDEVMDHIAKHSHFWDPLNIH